MNNDLPQHIIKELFTYQDGHLMWKVKRNGTNGIGSIAGCIDPQNYVVICVERKYRKAHRLIYIFHFGAIPEGFEIDHIDTIRHNNKIENLRLANHSQNQQNGRKYKNNTSGHKGVFFYPPNKWRARIGVNGKYKSLGLYQNFDAACIAYQNASRQFHNQFSNLN